MIMKAERVSVLVLLSIVLATKARLALSYARETDTDTATKKAGEDIVSTLIYNARADVVKQEDGALSPTDEEVKEEVGGLAEDALKLRRKIANLDNDDRGSHSNGDFENDLNNFQSDTGILYTDAEDLISDDRDHKPEIKTRSDLDLLRNQIGLFPEDTNGAEPENVATERPRRRRRKIRRLDKHQGTTEYSSKIINEESSDDRQADQPNLTSMRRDPRCDETLGRFTPEPTAMVPARSHIKDFNLSWLSCYLQTCQQCTTSSHGGQCPLTNQVLEMKKWANEVQELLTHGCVKPAGCNYPGTCCIAADMMIEHLILKIGEMLKDLHGMFQKKCVNCYNAQGILGDWASWSEWSSCDATCGRATRSRFRGCSPGKDCSGSPKETELCAGLPECCVHGNWANWENWNPCSVTCGRGQMTRLRRCSRPAPNYCGNPCAGKPDEMRVCESNEPCCGDRNWERWTSWSACSSSCGAGRRTRSRTCSSPPSSRCEQGCPGDNQQMESCSDPAGIVKGNWGAWQPWAACSVSCGRGSRNRRRACDNPPPGPCEQPCVGSDAEASACDAGANCCVDGKWSTWHAWSACSETCGTGSKRRRRLCDNPPANHCGRQCPDEGLEMTTCVTGTPCPSCINGNWGNWEPWNPCSVTCAQGNRERIRKCDSPPQNECGKRCQGRGFEVNVCDTGRTCDVCVDGQWGSWQPWAHCSATCGRGVSQRRRSCDSPPPNRCGQKCPDQDHDVRDCDSGRPCVSCVDGQWGSWQAWAQCSATCGRGVSQRRRSCDSPPPNRCGQKCPDPDHEVRDCDSGRPCVSCVNGNWGQWQPWSQCSGTCGRGTNTRRRSCDSPQPNYCGSSCPGQSSEHGACETGVPCFCVDGNWGTWQPWAQCSATCGTGTRSRRRSCDNPPADYCGKPCADEALGTGSCETGRPCVSCVDGNWGTWQPWTPCSATCGTGMRNRRRSCNNPPANYCGKTCVDDPLEVDSCETGRPCVSCVDGNWGTWQPWAQCSTTCGTGTRSRRRSCNNPPANYCGKTCVDDPLEVDSCETGRPCVSCVDGNWGTWQPWAQCSTTCGTGTRSRRRSCDNPPANYCGKTCADDPLEIDSCETGRPCVNCVDGNWGTWQPWAECSATCGTGTRNRRRSCNNPPANYCGKTCVDDPLEIDSCETSRPCVSCVDGNWGTWQPWAQCSATCGTGTRSRRRSCDNPPANYCGKTCVDDPLEVDSCETGRPCVSCEDASWTSWQPWSRCSMTCGKGTRERRRLCESLTGTECGQRCDGREFDTDVCENSVECVGCVDSTWGTWQYWSQCSVTCGWGTRQRLRSCNTPPFNSCGKECPGVDFDIGDCGTGESCDVCVDRTWGTWQYWSECSVTCGRGTRQRLRSCNTPPFNSCGRDCLGVDFDIGDCATGESCDVCVDRTWGTWQYWSECSVTCGRGTRQRLRSCNTPPFNSCGRECPGVGFDIGDCAAGESCDVCVNGNWGGWSQWSSCTASCKEELVARTRSCNNPAPNYCGTTCPNSPTEFRSQQCGPHPIDGVWSTWSSYSGCSVSCGIGFIQRSRNCNSPPPNICGKPCQGQTDERVTCKGTGLCGCEEKQWSDWAPWSPCSATCGQAVRTRLRACLTVLPGNDCTGDCPGDNQERMVCTGLAHCSSWGQWSACSVTCRGRGFRERIIITTTFVARGDMAVETNETRTDREECIITSPECATWGQWSACSVTCTGRGIRERIIMTTTFVGRGDVTVESNGTRTEREECIITSPECQTWSQWSECSATCRGQGVRERIIRTASRDVTTGVVAVGSNATLKEVQNCSVTYPECLYGEPGWSSWESWCPCDCRQGIRSRRRECEKISLQGLSPLKVAVAICRGEARVEEQCDTKLQCPECINNCAGLTPGFYPSCESCHHYISCQQDQSHLILQCTPANIEFDAFVKRCGAPPSPSCTLHQCITTCEDKNDGTYHSCAGCNLYVECNSGQPILRQCPGPQSEWNQQRKRCEPQKSPTCMRSKSSSAAISSTIIGGGLQSHDTSSSGRRMSTIIGGALQRDASHSSLPHKEQAETRKSSNQQIPENKQKQDRHNENSHKSNKLKQNVEKKSTKLNTQDLIHEKSQDTSKILNCKTHCYHADEGKYPSCRGCEHYIICTKSGQLQHKRCHGDRKWDDSTKSCRHFSSTCTRGR